MARRMTQGRAAKLYLQAHRDANYTSLPDDTRDAKHQLMGQLEREQPGTRERALVGSNKHFDQPLSSGEREHQAWWQQEHNIDQGELHQRRRALEQPDQPPTRRSPTGGRRRNAARRRRPSRRRAAAATASQLQSSPAGQTAGSAAGLWWDLFTGGVVLSIVYLAVASKNGPRVISGFTNGIASFFHHLASPSVGVFAGSRSGTAWPADAGPRGNTPSAGPTGNAPAAGPTGNTGAAGQEPLLPALGHGPFGPAPTLSAGPTGNTSGGGPVGNTGGGGPATPRYRPLPQIVIGG